jgi:AhpD family alkylhydroperoxidase
MEQQPRIPYVKVAPEAYQALWALEKHVRSSGLDPMLLNLVYLRVSQLNGCAYCIDAHAKDLRAGGETEQRIYELQAWREAPFYSDRERAALAWAEVVTSLGEDHVGEAAFAAARRTFSDHDLVELTLAIATINAWNRIAIAFRSVPGSYRPAKTAT